MIDPVLVIAVTVVSAVVILVIIVIVGYMYHSKPLKTADHESVKTGDYESVSHSSQYKHWTKPQYMIPDKVETLGAYFERLETDESDIFVTRLSMLDINLRHGQHQDNIENNNYDRTSTDQCCISQENKQCTHNLPTINKHEDMHTDTTEYEINETKNSGEPHNNEEESICVNISSKNEINTDTVSKLSIDSQTDHPSSSPTSHRASETSENIQLFREQCYSNCSKLDFLDVSNKTCIEEHNGTLDDTCSNSEDNATDMKERKDTQQTSSEPDALLDIATTSSDNSHHMDTNSTRLNFLETILNTNSTSDLQDETCSPETETIQHEDTIPQHELDEEANQHEEKSLPEVKYIKQGSMVKRRKRRKEILLKHFQFGPMRYYFVRIKQRVKRSRQKSTSKVGPSKSSKHRPMSPSSRCGVTYPRPDSRMCQTEADIHHVIHTPHVQQQQQQQQQEHHHHHHQQQQEHHHHQQQQQQITIRTEEIDDKKSNRKSPERRCKTSPRTKRVRSRATSAKSRTSCYSQPSYASRTVSMRDIQLDNDSVL